MQSSWLGYGIHTENIPCPLSYEALECDPKLYLSISSSRQPGLDQDILRKGVPKWTQPVAVLSLGCTDGERCDIASTPLLCALAENKQLPPPSPLFSVVWFWFWFLLGRSEENEAVRAKPNILYHINMHSN